MATKLPKDTYPAGTGPNDFECFGPIATEDAKFHDSRLADMGCFKQDGTDTNKAYHGAVVRCKASGKWFAYFEWGRTGKRGSFQFVEGYNEQDAIEAYVKQMESKNVKRGEWATVAGRRVLRAKPGKDCYLVRPLATRAADSFGLPSATSVVSKDVKIKKTTTATKTTKKASKRPPVDAETAKLMHDMNVATINYTKRSLQGGTIPTQDSIERGRELLQAARQRVLSVGDDVSAQINDSDLMLITQELFGRIPKIKPVGAPKRTWVLSTDNILQWDQDLDAYESALKTTVSIETEVESDVDPLGGMPITMRYLSPRSPEGEFLMKWMPRATRNRHHNYGDMRIRNMWYVERHGVLDKFDRVTARIAKECRRITERPDRQPAKRSGLTDDQAKLYRAANVGMLFHGTRSVNVTGILREGLRLPRQLVGVAITGAMFGGGLYWADDWKKSAGYCSLRNSYWARGGGDVKGRSAFMFVADVVLGVPHVAPGCRGYTGPPKGCHSVFGKANVSGVMNNEWIVYSIDQNNLRYLVEFDC
jgi:hypothetical protein